ncbi:MAG: adenylosuccinate synthetase, partial [Gammaproteobacteria bacterium]|nr:adenylosuccinate synthetase [Gammaproteobacteria bacterium]
KLDVLDGLEKLQICTGYEYEGKILDLPPVGADAIEKCKPIYEEMPGWSESTVGKRSLDDLPANAKAYLKRLEEIVDVPVDIVSTGPERDETIVLRNPYE